MTATQELRTTPRGPGLRARARGSRLVIIAVALLVGLVVLLVASDRDADIVPLSTWNTRASGTHAVTEILRDHGVAVRQVDRLAQARIEDPAATTLVVAEPSRLSSAQLASLDAYPGDVVVLGRVRAVLPSLGMDVRQTTRLAGGAVDAGCADPDARAAGEVAFSGAALETSDPDVALCFVDAGAAAMARAEVHGRTVTVLTASEPLTNAQLDRYGHAALAVRVLGAHPDVVWYVADGLDSSLLTASGVGGDDAPTDVETVPDFLPPGTGSAFYALALAVLVAAFWKARRFGALIAEPLPVVVRASEATRGRARLYRRARSTGRSAASLRAAAALRMGRRIGVARGESREALVAAVAHASGRPARDVDRLLYGPAPADEAALLSLISELDALESEVHRP
ncbi:DUF4350 domain-containing protein [Demequina mangrovi]|uniref:DUF4350 domain-containing protein n=1 Tax=Demequina mangrovi TaxID=1043493 RepID=A0A1H6X7K8_9MICO|nr:DUF4350 domain-containing protein [Demequina mangrovi]SEJ20880.1 protein of unknown function [Demequina mangrovi]